jgi:transposase
MNTKLHAIADANGRPLSFFMTAGQVSDYTGAAALLDDMPKAQWLLGDRGYDADWFRDALQAKGIRPCIPGRRSRNEPVRYDKRRYRRRSRIEIMFGRLKPVLSLSKGTGAGSPPATTAAPPPSSPPSPSLPPSSSGCDQRVLTLGRAVASPRRLASFDRAGRGFVLPP